MADELNKRDGNHIPTVSGVTDDANEYVTLFRFDPTTKRLKVDGGGIGLPSWDYVSLVQASTTDTYTFKTGGSGGTTVATVVLTFTDSTKQTLSNVTRT